MKQIILRLLARVYDDVELLNFVRTQLNNEDIDSIWRIYGEEEGGLKKEFLQLIKKEKEKSSFDTLVAKLKVLVMEVTEKHGYFFSPIDKKISCKNFFENSKYDVDKSFKVIENYYKNWNSDIKPKGVYNLILSEEWDSLYSNFKSRKEKINFDEY